MDETVVGVDSGIIEFGDLITVGGLFFGGVDSVAGAVFD